MLQLNYEKIQKMKQGYNKYYPVPEYLRFCEEVVNMNLNVTVKFSKTTDSKYVFVSNKDRTIKIRFSKHLPGLNKKNNNDSDYYVGFNNKNGYSTISTILSIIKKDMICCQH